MRHLLHVLAKGKRFKWVIVISPTSFNGEWSSIVGEDNVLSKFDPDQVGHLMDRQGELREDGVDNPGLLILDDCLGSCDFGSDLTSNKDKLYDGIIAISRRVTSIMPSIDGIPIMPSYNLSMLSYNLSFLRTIALEACYVGIVQ